MNEQFALFPLKVQERPEAPSISYGTHLEGSQLVDGVRLTFSENDRVAEIVRPDEPVFRVEEPFTDHIEAGKNTYVYDAHTYHTKVPPEGIKKLIEYYTRPGDTVLDPFCGSGMTGVAARETGRNAVLSDLSPAAAFIAYNFATPVQADSYMDAVSSLLKASEELESYLYGVRSEESGEIVPQIYTVWSFGVICPSCKGEFVLWDVARDEKPRVRDSKILSEFDCPHCHERVSKRGLKRTRRYPVQIGYPGVGKGLKEATKAPSSEDRAHLEEMERRGLPDGLWYPTVELPNGVNTRQPILAGIKTVDQFYTTRSLWALSHLWQLALDWPDRDVREKLLFTLTSLYKRITVFSEFRFWGGSGNTANFNVPAIMNEQNVFKTFERKAKTISWYFQNAPTSNSEVRVGCMSATDLKTVPNGSVDYVFTDPPFGGNINYSEMNVLWESWLGVRTDIGQEAIINKVQGKGHDEYRLLLTKSFSEIARVLKPGGWLTIVFHNSSADVWSDLQMSIAGAGLVIKGTQTFDKKHGTFKQFVSDNAVGYDLVLHCQPRSRSETANHVIKMERDDVISFISNRLDSSEYSVRYLHVRRAREFDYRRMYAEWLSASIASNRITIGFDEFRKLVDQVRSSR